MAKLACGPSERLDEGHTTRAARGDPDLRRLLAGLAAAATAISASPVTAAPAPVDDLLHRLHGMADAALKAPQWLMKATLYHGGGKGITSRDSMGCKVSPMRTLA